MAKNAAKKVRVGRLVLERNEDVVREVGRASAERRKLFCRRLVMLREYLNLLPERAYHHGSFGKMTPCGTVACAAGHAALSGLYVDLGVSEVAKTRGIVDSTDILVRGKDMVFTSRLEPVFGPGVSDLFVYSVAMDRAMEVSPDERAAVVLLISWWVRAYYQAELNAIRHEAGFPRYCITPRFGGVEGVLRQVQGVRL